MHTTPTHLQDTRHDCKPGKQSAVPNKSPSTSNMHTTRQQQTRAKPTPPPGAAHPGAPAAKRSPARQRARRVAHKTTDAQQGTSAQRTARAEATYQVATGAPTAAPEEGTLREHRQPVQQHTPRQQQQHNRSPTPRTAHPPAIIATKPPSPARSTTAPHNTGATPAPPTAVTKQRESAAQQAN
jgi:hypothetical protein